MQLFHAFKTIFFSEEKLYFLTILFLCAYLFFHFCELFIFAPVKAYFILFIRTSWHYPQLYET